MHSGVFGEIKFKCSECEKNPKLSEAWGCINEPKVAVPLLEEIEGGIKYVYKRCPIKFIPKSIIVFIRMYDYFKNFPGAPMPSYDKADFRFVSAYQYYESKLAEFTKEKIKNG